MKKSALIAGATGLTGSSLLEKLLNNPGYEVVYSVVRKATGNSHAKLQEIIINFDEIKYAFPEVKQIDDVYCCLGTTIKKAGSKEAFRKVDYQYSLDLAERAHEIGAKHFLCISAMGANAKSGIFYSKIKGEMERDVSIIQIPAITFFRPSLLIGNRKEHRAGERVGIILSKILNPLMVGGLKNYKGIHVNNVADAMIKAAVGESKGVKVVLSDEMQ